LKEVDKFRGVGIENGSNSLFARDDATTFTEFLSDAQGDFLRPALSGKVCLENDKLEVKVALWTGRVLPDFSYI